MGDGNDGDPGQRPVLAAGGLPALPERGEQDAQGIAHGHEQDARDREHEDDVSQPQEHGLVGSALARGLLPLPPGLTQPALSPALPGAPAPRAPPPKTGRGWPRSSANTALITGRNNKE